MNMKKKLTTLVLLAMSIVAMPALAQTASQGQRGCRKQNSCATVRNCDKNAGRKGDGKGSKQFADSARAGLTANPFEGLNLTEQQQQRLKAIPTPRQVMKTARQGSPENGTGTGAVVKSDKLIGKDIRANYLKEISTVLTPEQYVRFLENSYVGMSPQKVGKARGNNGKQGLGKQNGNRRSHNGNKVDKVAQL